MLVEHEKICCVYAYLRRNEEARTPRKTMAKNMGLSVSTISWNYRQFDDGKRGHCCQQCPQCEYPDAAAKRAALQKKVDFF